MGLHAFVQSAPGRGMALIVGFNSRSEAPFGGCSKTCRCEASEALRNEAYWDVRRSDEGRGNEADARFGIAPKLASELYDPQGRKWAFMHSSSPRPAAEWRSLSDSTAAQKAPSWQADILIPSASQADETSILGRPCSLAMRQASTHGRRPLDSAFSMESRRVSGT